MEQRKAAPVRVLFMDHVPRLSGAEQSLADLVVGLAQGPVEPIVVLPEDGPLAHQLRAHGVLVRMVPMSKRMLQTSRESLGRKPLLAVARLFAFIAAGWRTFRLIRETDPALVHTNTLKSHLIALVPCKLARVPLVWHMRDILPDGWLQRAVVGLGRFTEAIIVPSRAAAEPFKGNRALLRKVRLVPNGINVQDFQDARADRSLREMMGASRGDLVIGLVARIAPWKGQDVFLRAASMLADRYPRAIFAIIGAPLFAQDDDYERALHQMAYDLRIEDRVVFCGWQPAPEAMAACDIIVHASQEPEPFGRTIVEAMAAGKPVVATEGGAVREILPPACGLIVPPGRPELLADALDRMMEDRKILKRMGESSAAIADSYFPVQRTIQSVAQVYRALLGKSRKRPGAPQQKRRRARARRVKQKPAQQPVSWQRPDERPREPRPPVRDRLAGRDPREPRFDAGDGASRPVHPSRPASRRRQVRRPEGPRQEPRAPRPEPRDAMPAPEPAFDEPDFDAPSFEPVTPPRRPEPPVARAATLEAPVEAPPKPKRVRALTKTKQRVRVDLDVLDEPRTVRPVAVPAPEAPAREEVVAAPAPAPVSAPAIPSVPDPRTFELAPKPLYDALKRALDLIIAFTVLVVGAPVWLCVAIAIKLESPGPVFHRGTVYGRGCTPFTYYKFRSMRIDGDDKAHRRFIERYVRENGGHEHDGEVIYKLMGDDRVTGVGRLIRKLSIDEVPQLLNVLLGQMSIVGPRPPLDYEFEHYDDVAKMRMVVKPGITGMQQVWHRHSASFEDKLKLDMKYIEQRSTWLDLKLILHTPGAALRGH